MMADESSIDLLRRMAVDDPFHTIQTDWDASETECFWCGVPADYEWENKPGGAVVAFAAHATDCPWFAARSLVGAPVERHTRMAVSHD